MTELQLQAACTIWFQNNMIAHRGKFRRVKNETDLKGKQGVIMGQLNKATGIVKGTWDAFLIVEPICWIEFKTDKGYLSPEQKMFQNFGEQVNWNFRTVRSLEDFQKICKEFFTK
jgi:hypothetical protein